MIKRIIEIFISRGLAAAGTVLLTMAVPVFYSIYESATFFTGFALLYILSIVARCGFDIYILRESAVQFSEAKKTIEVSHILLLLLTIIISILIAVVWFILQKYFPHLDHFAWVMWTLPAFSGLGLISFYLRGSGNEVWAALTEPGSLSLLTVILLLWTKLTEIENLDLSYSFAVIAWSAFFFNLVVFYFNYRIVSSCGFNLRRDFLASYIYLVNQLASYASQWFPVFLFNYSDKDLVVYFSVANRLATIVTFVGATIDSFSAPRFSAYWKAKDLAGLVLFKSKMRRLASIISVAAFLLVLVASLGYGLLSEFDRSFFILVTILLLGYAVSIGMGPNGYLLIMTSYSHYATKVTVVGCLLIVLMAAFFAYFEEGLAVVGAVSLVTAVRSYLFKYKVDLVIK